MFKIFTRKSYNKLMRHYDNLIDKVNRQTRTITRLHEIIATMRNVEPEVVTLPTQDKPTYNPELNSSAFQRRRFDNTNIMDDQVVVNTNGTSFGDSIIDTCEDDKLFK